MKENYDIVIIGSGAGGGTCAEYLSRFKDKNLSILMLESGPYRKKEHFNQTERDMTSMFYKRGGYYSKNLEIGLAAGNTVGGSTAMYTGVSFRPPSSVLEKWRTEFGLDFLKDNYANKVLDEIEKQINVHELPEEWDNDNNRLFKEGAQKLGFPLKRLRINVKGCQQQGFCNLGCTSGGKQGTLEVQVPQAIENGVELIHNAEVNTITNNSVDFSVKPAIKASVPNSIPEGKHSVKAKVIIVAAGVLNTPALIRRSENGLHISNDMIGRYVTLHPALNTNGIYKEPLKNYRGFPKTWYIDHFSDSDGFYLETSFYYPGVTAKNNPGFGKVHWEIMRKYRQMMSILILTHDHAEKHNRIDIDKNGKPVLDYTVSKEVRQYLVKALRRSAEIFFAAGCLEMLSPGAKNPLIRSSQKEALDSVIIDKELKFHKTPLASAHPQGGMRMGNDPLNSVVDINGKLRGTESVYIADASLFPTSVKVNPYETVMLMARYVSEQVLQQHFN